MAGLDTDFAGEAWAAEGVKVGYLRAGAAARSRQGRAGQRRGGAGRDQGAARPLRRGQRQVRRAARRRRDGRAARRAGRAAGEDRRRRRLGARPHARDRHGRAALPARRRRRRARSPAASGAASRSAGCCCSSPTCCCSTSRPTISTPNRSPGSSASSQDYPGTVVAVTHDRYFLDNVAGWILELDRGRGIPCEGNYSSWLEQKQKRLAQEEKQEAARQRTLARELEWIRQSPRARQAKSKARITGLRGRCWRRAATQAPGTAQIVHPARPAPRRPGDRGRAPAQGLRRPAADRRPRASAAARRHRRRHRPERRRQDDAVPHDHRPGEARRRQPRASARR